jgi:predicted AlkP superfamily pyrophosphatase or phosphodiesterase
MLLKDVEKHVCGSEKNGIVYPLYDGYSLVNVPNTALYILGAKPVGKTLDKSIIKHIDTKNIKKIVVLLLDGFGYDMFLKSLEYASFFRKVADNGIFAPITSGFPSSTAVSITTMNTGEVPTNHGILSWIFYSETSNQIINVLNHNKDKRSRMLSQDIFHTKSTVFGNFKKSGIHPYTLIDYQIDKTDYNQSFRSKRKSIYHVKDSDFAIKLREILENEKEKSYFFAYLNGIDTITHIHGPHSEASEAEISLISNALESSFLSKLSKKTASETLLIITADHGHIRIYPKKTIYLNKFKKLNNYYKLDKNKKPIPPIGSPRYVFMHIKPEKLEEAYAFLSKKLSKTAKVVKLTDASESDRLLSSNENKKFLKRAGNLLILPYTGKSVWYQHEKGHKERNIGVHGGLSPEEMLIPFAAVRLSKIL